MGNVLVTKTYFNGHFFYMLETSKLISKITNPK